MQTDHKSALLKECLINFYIQIRTTHNVFRNLIEIYIFVFSGNLRIHKYITCPTEHPFGYLFAFPTNGRGIDLFPING
ncbi:hypothetical protein D3C87_1362670 [compost metagenome]